MRIIAADDEQDGLEILLRAINEAVPTAEVRGFGRASMALAEVEERGFIPDVAFLDIEMPGIGGIELAKRIKDIYHNTNIIFVTGYRRYAYEASEMHASGYVLKPVSAEHILEEMDNLRYPIYTKSTKRIRIQCFGSFEVFADNEQVEFISPKAKELLAYLVDRRGASLTTAELVKVLWENGEGSGEKNHQLHSCIEELEKSLDAVGAKEIFSCHRNSAAVNPAMFDCDCYECVGDNPAAINAYKGEYMSQYPWARFSIDGITTKP